MKRLLKIIMDTMRNKKREKVFWFIRWTIRFSILLPLFLGGCANGRVWGDNFLRNWFNDIRWEQQIQDNKVLTTTNTGMRDSSILLLTLIAPIPVVIVCSMMLVRLALTRERGIRFLVSAIEESSSLQEVKRLSRIFGRTNIRYDRIVKSELKRIKSHNQVK